MYKFSYEEALSESGSRQRENERQVLQQSVELLKSAEKAGQNSREAIDAIFFINRLWSYLLDDLAKPGNALPDDIRANLISIGIWMLREAEAISNGKSHNFSGLIEVSNIVAEGL
jgi:flagellar biosynthesis activator protein FlaF